MADEGDSGHGRRRERQISAPISHKVNVTLLMNRNDTLKVNDVVVHGKARASREAKKKGNRKMRSGEGLQYSINKRIRVNDVVPTLRVVFLVARGCVNSVTMVVVNNEID